MKKGFTLAEVLIVIGIIGVVAAMTIPTLIKNMQYKHLSVELKKVYSEWNQVSMQFMEDNGISIPAYTTTNGGYKLYEKLKKYVKGITLYKTWHSGMRGDNYDEGLENLPYEIYTFGGKKVTFTLPCDTFGFYTDNKGRIISFDDNPSTGYNGPRLCIDINGIQPPNTLGIDIFNFLFTVDGKVIPEGQYHKFNKYGNFTIAGTALASPNLCQQGSGFSNAVTCAYYALNDKNPKGNGTYWKDFLGKKQY